MKIAIIGGGIFGVTTAIRLSRNHDVDLFEQNSDILQSASGINQYRLHRGYHYPRSTDTAISAKNSELFFKNDFLILELRIVASYLGFVPTKIIKSLSSIPFNVELKI